VSATLALADHGYAFNVAPGESEADKDLGNYQDGAVSGTKFEDLDADGIDASDPPLGGWTIVAFADDGDGDLSQAEYDAGPAGSDVSDNTTGDWSISLPPGDYVICEVIGDQTGWSQSVPDNTRCDGINTGTDPALADGGFAVAIQSSDTTTNVDKDFANYERVRIKVNKTVNGTIPLPQAFTFKILQGASTADTSYTEIASGTTDLTTGMIGPDDWTEVNGDYPLVPGDYQLCEMIVNGYTPDFVLNGTYGTDWFSPGITAGPGIQDLENLLACFDFSVTSGDAVEDHTFTIDNTPPGMARTIGYWKNWTGCDGNGNQDAVLDEVISTLATDNWTPNGEPISGPDGSRDIRLGDLLIQGPNACALAVDILDKRLIGQDGQVGDGRKIANSPAWNAGSQLLAYELNKLNTGGAACAAADTAAGNVRRILNKIGFTGKVDPNMTKNEKEALNFYAGILDDFNNNTLICSTSVVPKPGVPGSSFDYSP
jgi:hypothetical protein